MIKGRPKLGQEGRAPMPTVRLNRFSLGPSAPGTEWHIKGLIARGVNDRS
jgi:hypothetical protein